LGLALILYLILFFSSDLIASIYDNSSIAVYLRVIGLMLFLTPFNSVQLGFVYNNMLFKRLLISTLVASIISGAVGIVMAKIGFGAWALVAQTILNSMVSVIMLLILVKWKPRKQFSFNKLKYHFSYGWKLLLSSVLDTLYNEMRSLVIGKRYTVDDLSFYNRGDSYPKTVMTSLNNAVQTVMFPVLSAEQDDLESLKSVMKKTVALSSFIIFPIMAGFAATAESFVRLVLTDKWLPCVPYLQLACLIYAIQPINSCNLQAIKAIGRSDIFLILEVIKKLIGFLLLFLSVIIFKTPMGIAITASIYAPIQLIINVYPNRKLIHYSFLEQLKDIAVPLCMSITMFVIVYLLNTINVALILKIAIQIVAGIVVYVFLSWIFKIPAMYLLISKIKTIMRRK
jgi:O-antigen/teichoic acid export membrane protein